jgi:hypothetical protein
MVQKQFKLTTYGSDIILRCGREMDAGEREREEASTVKQAMDGMGTWIDGSV